MCVLKPCRKPSKFHSSWTGSGRPCDHAVTSSRVPQNISSTTPCVQGTFNSAGSSSSGNPYSSCNMGKKTSIYGATACDSCEAGRVAALNGSSCCAECRAGYFTAEGASVCDLCSAGRFGTLAGSSFCLCDAGYRTDDISSVCVTSRSTGATWMPSPVRPVTLVAPHPTRV